MDEPTIAAREGLERLKARHEAAKQEYANFAVGYGSITYCSLCGARWPCDAFQVASFALTLFRPENRHE